MGGGLGPCPSVWMAVCLSCIAVFEVGASLKWMPLQSKLKSGTWITKKKKRNCQGSCYTVEHLKETVGCLKACGQSPLGDSISF